VVSFFVTIAITWAFSSWFSRVELVKRFVNVHLHCIVSNLKRISKILALPSPEKISANAHERNDRLVDLAQWFLNKGGEGSKIGRAEANQTGAQYFQRYVYFSVSVYSI